MWPLSDERVPRLFEAFDPPPQTRTGGATGKGPCSEPASGVDPPRLTTLPLVMSWLRARPAADADVRSRAEIADLPQHLRPAADAARAAINAAFPPGAAAIRSGHPTWSVGKAPGCYLKAASQHFSFGFGAAPRGDDPNRRLETSGQAMAHVKRRTPQDVDPGQVRPLDRPSRSPWRAAPEQRIGLSQQGSGSPAR